MKNKFFPLKVLAVEKTTPDCSIVSFEVNEDLREQFRYRAGQYLTVQATIDGERERRSYSLCSAVQDNEWKVAVKQIEGGKFSGYVNNVLKPGDVLEVMAPMGKFCVPPAEGQPKNYIAFAAGSGITPVFSLIKSHLHTEPDCTFKLFYVNQSVGSIILKEELEALKNRYMNRFEIFHFLTREERNIELFNGRITSERLDTIFDKLVDLKTIDDYFVCGPEPFIFLIRDYLLEAQVDAKKIHFELFTTVFREVVKNKSAAKRPSGKSCDVTIVEGGKRFKFQLERGDTSILDAALQRSADLPFACKGGVCCTCRAKLLEGEVDMQVNYALEAEEVAAGYILACQSIPTTDKVVVDFDV